MASTNIRTTKSHVYEEERLAGGYGTHGAKQPEEQQLRRLVMACMLWEDNAYSDGLSVVDSIKNLVHKLPPPITASIAVEARFQQKLRHVPLLLCRELARHPDIVDCPNLLVSILEKVIHRPDEMTEFLSLYWKDNLDGDSGKKKTLSAQVKKGLSAAFQKFDEYQLAKYNRKSKTVSLKDVLSLCHPKPKDPQQEDIWNRLLNNKLTTPDTWEVGLSKAKTPEDKRDVWVHLIESKKLGASAFLKNLRNMKTVDVPRSVIVKGLSEVKSSMLLPLDFLKAAQYAPEWTRELEDLLYRCAAEFPKIPGWTVFVVDVSGSMNAKLSKRSQFTRMSAAVSLAVLAAEMCEHISVYATAGSDYSRIHNTQRIRPLRGFALSQEILDTYLILGGGGIFTRQCLEYIKEQEKEIPDRVIIFSDSQDCDEENARIPKPFGRYNYIADVSSEKYGVNYKGLWTAEISGWSEYLLSYIAEYEKSSLQ